MENVDYKEMYQRAMNELAGLRQTNERLAEKLRKLASDAQLLHEGVDHVASTCQTTAQQNLLLEIPIASRQETDVPLPAGLLVLTGDGAGDWKPYKQLDPAVGNNNDGQDQEAPREGDVPGI